jgi:phosphoribosylaminoimidazole-succinocarboxamide synthase
LQTRGEFGIVNGELLIDECLTPDLRDSGRKTNTSSAEPPSFDKQFVRDYLETLDWNKLRLRRVCRRM